jgi:hypothetical protein
MGTSFTLKIGVMVKRPLIVGCMLKALQMEEKTWHHPKYLAIGIQ